MIYKNIQVAIPPKTIIMKNNSVYLETSRSYDKNKKYNVPSRTCIGKKVDNKMMNPNDSYYELVNMSAPILKEPPISSDTISIGFNVVMDKLLKDSQIDILLKEIYSHDEYFAMRDLMSYIISNETSTIQHYPSWARRMNILSDTIRSDSYYCNFFKDVITDKKIELFLSAWNSLERNQDKLYISYDSTNMNTNSVGIELAEIGHAKVDEDLPQVNLSYAINQKESLPLFYELYPGSNIDNSQLKHMVNRSKEYGYKDLGVILDRGYYARANINYLKNNGFDYLLMVKTSNELITSLIKESRYVLPKAKYFIEEHNVFGKTFEAKLYDGDKTNSYVHLYFDSTRSADETKDLLKRQSFLENELDNHISAHKKKDDLKKSYPSFKLKADEEGYLISYKTNEEYLDELSDTFGFFCIITSKNMNAKEALNIYRDRDSVEKLFESLKSEMDYKKFRISSSQSLKGKTFIIFVSSIIRSRIYHLCKPLKVKNRKDNTVPAIIRELNNIEVSKNAKGNYVRRYSLTAKQKNILSQFNLAEKDIDAAIVDINGKILVQTND